MTTEIAHRLRIHHKKGRERARRQANECFKGDHLPKNSELRFERKLQLFNIEHDLLLECWTCINSMPKQLKN